MTTYNEMPTNSTERREHRPFLASEMVMSSVTLQKDVSFVSPSPTGLWEEEGLSRSLTVDKVHRVFVCF